MINKDNSVISNKKTVVACDLFLNLDLYHVPGWLQEFLKVAFPNIEIVPVNTPNSQKTNRGATVYWGNRITMKMIHDMPNLKWIHFGSVGVNRVNVEKLMEKGITVTSSKGLVVSSMVASALAFMTSLARGLHYSQFLRNKGEMSREKFDIYFDHIHELSNETCLIVGFGDVGRRLLKICNALEMNVSVIRRSKEKVDLVDKSYTLEQILDAVSRADYIVNLLPLTKKTKGIFTREVFNNMKKGSFFINIGRGETVEEDSLIEVLKNEHLSGAGLDVFENEPLAQNSPLWKMENVLLSPHVAGLSKGYWDRQADLFVHNLEYHLKGKESLMRNIVKTN